MSWSLTRKVSAALLAVLVSTMLITAFFGYYKFENVLSSLVQSRYSYIVFTIKKKVEDSLNLGFALRQLRQVQDAIDREKIGDDRIVSIEVFDAKGETLFNTDRGMIGSTVPRHWTSELGTEPFSHRDEDALIVGLPLVNSLGKIEGGVALRYPAAYVGSGQGQLLLDVGLTGLMALVIFAVIAVVAANILFHSVFDELGIMEDRMAHVLYEGGAPPRDIEGDGFNTFPGFVAKTREAMDHLRDAAEEVEHLDRLS